MIVRLEELVDWKGFRIFPQNEPLKKSGAYLFLNLVGNKPYIGVSKDVYSRIISHLYENSKLSKDIRELGRDKFLVFPLFYSVVNDLEWLLFTELDLIQMYESVKNGYNIKQSLGSSLLRTEEFSRYLREIHKNPERKLRQREQLKKRWNSEEARRSHARIISNLKWITNGTKNHRILKNQYLPVGWRLGRVFTKVWSRKEVSCRPGVREQAAQKAKKAWTKIKQGALRANLRICYNCYIPFKYRSNPDQVTCSQSCSSILKRKVYGNPRRRKDCQK